MFDLYFSIAFIYGDDLVWPLYPFFNASYGCACIAVDCRFTPVMEAAAPASRRDPYGQADQCTLGGSASTTHDRGEVAAGGGGGGPRSHAEPHLAAQGREYSGYSGLPSYGALPPFALSQSEV